jgi:ribosomal protein L11 methyltransferase
MKYIEVKIHATTAGAEVITALLEARGVVAVSLEDPKDIADILERRSERSWDYYDPSLLDSVGSEAILTFYLDAKPESDALVSSIRAELSSLSADTTSFGPNFSFGSLTIQTAVRSDEEWADTWKAYFKPFRFARNIWVRPSWENFQPTDDDAQVITLDPGMAFGTGKHETTAMCAALMARFLKPGMSALDVGCGSGILLITACLLGAKEVLGVDVDDDAIAAARANISINGCAAKAEVVKADLLKGIARKADVITGNLSVDLISRLAMEAPAHLNPDGKLIISGVLSDKRSLAEAILNESGFRLNEVMESGEWLAFAASLRSRRNAGASHDSGGQKS